MKSFLVGGTTGVLVSLVVFWLLFQWYVPQNYIDRDEGRLIAERNNMLLSEIDSLRDDLDTLRFQVAQHDQRPAAPDQDVTEQWIQRRVDVHRELKVRTVRDLKYEYISMPIGEATLPEESRQSILDQIAMADEGTVYLVVGITDDLPYAPPFADLKQQGLALKRAKYVKELIEDHYGQRDDIFIDVLMDQTDRRGIMVSRIQFEPAERSAR
ncbi:hypothetical protein [Desulfurispira natronophila]|uniref:Uncharacterized protein n=1 Tax=Desulfurispira natronophila TaxID=682562 RepID=A0A7W7Y5P4_9BACT|nr:hypothetical protein [Desulfurispira natronophila]MBB5022566.1 hypothetical protein [Desulfurispira natronophila]